MSDTDNEKPKLGMRAPLGLKRTVETGKVKQSFSHGRSNTVVVEVKRRRILGPGGVPTEAPAPVEAAPAPAPAAPQARAPEAPRAPSPGDSLLSRQELQAKLLREADESRMNALEESRRREERERIDAADEERRRAEERAQAAEAKPEPEAPVAPAAAPTPAPATPTPAAPVAAAPAAAPTPAPAPVPAAPISVELDPSMPAPRRFTPVARPERPAPR